MKSTRFNRLAAAALGAAIVVATPAMAFHGGGGFGGGGFHGGGFGGGGFHGGAIRFGGGAPFVRQHAFVHNNFAFRRFNRFNNVVFFGAPFVGAGYGYECWRRVWTNYGWRWANLCGDYGY